MANNNAVKMEETAVKLEEVDTDQGEFDQDTDDEGVSYYPRVLGAPLLLPKLEEDDGRSRTMDTTKKITTVSSKRRRRRKEYHSPVFEKVCSNCFKSKKREKFTSKQWQKGKFDKHGKKVIICRRCEEKSLIRHQVGRHREHLCIRIHTKTCRSSKSKCIATVFPMNTKLTFLPSELTLDGYTREPWSMEGNEFDSAWQTTQLRCLVGGEKMVQFLEFLGESRKSAYGTFVLNDGTDGFFFVPYYQSTTKVTLDKGDMSTKFICKYILGLGLLGSTSKTTSLDDAPAEEEEESKYRMEDYIPASLLGSLLYAQGNTDYSLNMVPKGTVKAAPKLQSCPNRPKHTGYSRSDWYAPKILAREENDDDDEVMPPGKV